MKYLVNLLRSIGKKLKFHWNQFCANLPFRMQLGKFGIWLAKVGRTLQTRYANWNSEFRLEHRFHPNHDACSIDVSEPVIRTTIMTFDGSDSQLERQPLIAKKLFGIKGVKKITLMPYEISLLKGRVFSWQEILPRIDEVILRHLTAK